MNYIPESRNLLFVDCNRLLAKFPRSMILMNDGFHISVSAHELIGQAAGQAIVADIQAKSAITMPVGKGNAGA